MAQPGLRLCRNVGHPLLFAGTKPQSRTRDEAIHKLHEYMTAKKHQTRSDRNLGLLLDHRRQIISVIYMNNQPADDRQRTASKRRSRQSASADVDCKVLGDSSEIYLQVALTLRNQSRSAR